MTTANSPNFGSGYDDTLNLLRNTTNWRLFLAIFFSFLTVVGWESVAVGDLLLAPNRGTGEIVIFDRHGDWWDRSLHTGDPIKIGGKWHGHVRPWDMHDQKMKKTLIDAGWFNRKGKYLGE